jgi:tRNA 5-methylaminomethyl-2-thiouridine biosynthesis bifunctional protein
LLESAGLALLPLWPLRGQVLRIPASEKSAALKTVLCAEGYCTPALTLSDSPHLAHIPHSAPQHIAGATFDKGVKHLDVLVSGHIENLQQVGALSPTLAALTENIHPKDCWGRASFRCTGPDFTPVIGEIAPGLWTSLAHGARGLLSAPLAACILAEQISTGESSFPQDLLSAIDPRRFVEKTHSPV